MRIPARGPPWTSNRAFEAYPSRVLIVGYSYGYFAARDLVRMGVWLTVVEFLVLLLLLPFYWPLIGLK
jgi:di/tricarboxylate transporter